jgi:hypothetical protein
MLSGLRSPDGRRLGFENPLFSARRSIRLAVESPSPGRLRAIPADSRCRQSHTIVGRRRSPMGGRRGSPEEIWASVNSIRISRCRGCCRIRRSSWGDVRLDRSSVASDLAGAAVGVVPFSPLPFQPSDDKALHHRRGATSFVGGLTPVAGRRHRTPATGVVGRRGTEKGGNPFGFPVKMKTEIGFCFILTVDRIGSDMMIR